MPELFENVKRQFFRFAYILRANSILGSCNLLKVKGKAKSLSAAILASTLNADIA